MRNLTIGDLKLALRDLLGGRVNDLCLSSTGKLYEPRLRAKQREIEAIPDAVGTQTPLVSELSDTDVRHDGFGAAIFYLCRAIDAHPLLPSSLKAAAEEIQETFVPALDVLRAPYADEATAALDNRADLAALKAELQSIATPGDGTLYDWVRGFLSAGEDIDKLLRKRAVLLATGDSAASTGPLRSATVGLLGRFREALRDEIQEAGSKLPAGHEAQLFAYIDKLNADGAARGHAAPDDGASGTSDDGASGTSDDGASGTPDDGASGDSPFGA